MNDELEFNQIYTMFQPKIYRYLTRIIGAKNAEDVTQDVFIKVGKALGTFNHQSQMSTWIYQIATNTAIDKMRSRSFKQESIEEYGLLESDVNAMTKQNSCSCNSSRSVEEQAVHNEMNECIRHFIMNLPKNYRTVLVLSELEGLKICEIAAVLGVSIGTVKIRLHRAKEKLKKELMVNCIFYRTECNELACEPKGVVTSIIKPFTKKH